MNSAVPNAVFVYGTLKRRQCRESMWPAAAEKIQQAYVFGSLFGRADYPAMIHGNDRVLGELWQFAAEQMPVVLAALDRIEGTGQPNSADLYHRVVVEVFARPGTSLGKAFTYLYARDPLADGFESIPAAGDSYVAWPAGV